MKRSVVENIIARIAKERDNEKRLSKNELKDIDGCLSQEDKRWIEAMLRDKLRIYSTVFTIIAEEVARYADEWDRGEE